MNLRNSQQAHLAEDQSLNQCNVVHTLRSRKKVDNQVSTLSKPIQHNHTQPSTSSSPSPSKSDESKIDKSTSQVHQPIVLFPNRLKNNKQNPHIDKIIEIFNQVKINVPLLDAIQQVPSYTKFLKDMCTKKRKTNVPKKVFLATNISELLSGPIPITYKDLGCPTIACTIGQAEISRALLDLGASINLLPFSVYQQLGLGNLSPIRVTIQLADRSVKVPKKKTNDIHIQVGEFIYSVDFIVRET